MKASSSTVNLLRTSQAASFLSCSRFHLAHLIRAGQLTVVDVRVPGHQRPRWRVPRASLERFILRRTDGTGGKKFWPGFLDKYSGKAKPGAAMQSKKLPSIGTPALAASGTGDTCVDDKQDPSPTRAPGLGTDGAQSSRETNKCLPSSAGQENQDCHDGSSPTKHLLP